jgi:hypothetical protein
LCFRDRVAAINEFFTKPEGVFKVAQITAILILLHTSKVASVISLTHTT